MVNDESTSSLDLDKCFEWIKTNSYETICLQFPDELMHLSGKTAFEMKNKLNVRTFIIGDTTIQNCCIDNLNAQRVKADALIHFGHACLSSSIHLPTFYIFIKQSLDVKDFGEKFYSYFDNKDQSIVLFYDTSYSHVVEDIYETLISKFKKLTISMLDCVSNVDFVNTKKKDTEETTCGRSYKLDSEAVAMFLGKNEKTLAALSTSSKIKTWYYFDETSFKRYDYHCEIFFKRKYFLIEKIKDAQSFGILITSFDDQSILNLTSKMQYILQKMNKKFYIIAVGRVTPEKLANLNEIDVFICVSCAEMALQQFKDFLKPVVIPYEIEAAFSEAVDFSNFHPLDFRQLLQGGNFYADFVPKCQAEVSLVSGKMRSDETDVSDQEKCTDLSLISNIVNLRERHWFGLDQEGDKEYSSVELGREGIPINYKNEFHE